VLDRGWLARARDPGNIGSARVQECGISSVTGRHYKRFDLIGPYVPRSLYFPVATRRYAICRSTRGVEIDSMASRPIPDPGSAVARRSNERCRSHRSSEICIYPDLAIKLRQATSLPASLTIHPVQRPIIRVVESRPVSATQIAARFVHGRERRIRNRVRYVNASGSRYPILDIASKLARSIRHGSRRGERTRCTHTRYGARARVCVGLTHVWNRCWYSRLGEYGT